MLFILNISFLCVISPNTSPVKFPLPLVAPLSHCHTVGGQQDSDDCQSDSDNCHCQMSVTNISVSPSLATCQAVSTDHCQLSALTTAMVNGHSLLEGVNSGRNLAHFLESRKLQEDPLSPSPPAPPHPPCQWPFLARNVWGRRALQHCRGGSQHYVGEAHNTIDCKPTSSTFPSLHWALATVLSL